MKPNNKKKKTKESTYEPPTLVLWHVGVGVLHSPSAMHSVMLLPIKRYPVLQAKLILSSYSKFSLSGRLSILPFAGGSSTS